MNPRTVPLVVLACGRHAPCVGLCKERVQPQSHEERIVLEELLHLADHLTIIMLKEAVLVTS